MSSTSAILKALLFTVLIFGMVQHAFSPKAEPSESDRIPYLGLINGMYDNLDGERPPFDLFLKGVTGFAHLKSDGVYGDKNIISLIDFRIPSSEERMWIIDLNESKVLLKTLVAHGRNSGELMAKSFSNKPESYQSSIGFYKTLKPYQGKHGLSLRLEGLQKGLNDKAHERAIVLHGADYVSETFAQQTGRLGRSLGCPAVPVNQTQEIINLIKEDNCLFIYFPNEQIDHFTSKEPTSLARLF
jgi:hypothetical protein